MLKVVDTEVDHWINRFGLIREYFSVLQPSPFVDGHGVGSLGSHGAWPRVVGVVWCVALCRVLRIPCSDPGVSLI